MAWQDDFERLTQEEELKKLQAQLEHVGQLEQGGADISRIAPSQVPVAKVASSVDLPPSPLKGSRYAQMLADSGESESVIDQPMSVNPRLAAAFASTGVAPRPETIPNVAQPPAQAAPQALPPKIVQVPDAALMDANVLDDDARRNRGLEAAARHLIAGFTRTQLAPTLSEGSTAVDKLLAARQLQRKNDFEAQHYGNEDKRLSNEATRLALEDKRLGMQGGTKVDPLLEQKKAGLVIDNQLKEKKLNAPPAAPKAAKTPGLSKDGTELRK